MFLSFNISISDPFVYTIQDLKKTERELMAKEAELNRREQVYTS
jgi:hypothetical protein